MIASKLQIRTRKSIKLISNPHAACRYLGSKSIFSNSCLLYFPEVKQIAGLDLFTHCCISFFELAADNLKMGQ